MKASLLNVSCCLVISTIVLTGCERGTETETAGQPPQPQPRVETTIAPRPDTPAKALYKDSGIATVTERSIETVNSVALRYPANAPDTVVIRATGIVTSSGWWNPRLTALDDETLNPGVKKYRFVATPPDGPETGLGGPLHVQLRVDGVGLEVEAIEVVSATNSISVMIARPQAAQTAQLQ